MVELRVVTRSTHTYTLHLIFLVDNMYPHFDTNHYNRYANASHIYIIIPINLR